MNLNLKIIQIHKSKGFFWIRMFGVGFNIKNVRIHGLLFCERTGKIRYLRFGNYRLIYLKRIK